jgi:hypothetical protein
VPPVCRLACDGVSSTDVSLGVRDECLMFPGSVGVGKFVAGTTSVGSEEQPLSAPISATVAADASVRYPRVGLSTEAIIQVSVSTC